jgi:PRTRC genetic system protein B
VFASQQETANMLNLQPDNAWETPPTILSEEQKMPIAEFALCFFKNGDQIDGVTHHEIQDNEIGIGKYVDKEHILSWLNKIAITSAESFVPKNEWIEDHILINNNNMFVFYTKSFKDRLWIRTGNGNGNRHCALRVPFPALLYKVDRINRSLSVWALDRDKRPTLKSTVYHAPLMNVSCHGRLCQGTAPIPEVLTNDCSEGVIKALFESNFSHVNHHKTLKLESSESIDTEQYITFFESIQEEVDFPSQHLMPTGMNIEQILARKTL